MSIKNNISIISTLFTTPSSPHNKKLGKYPLQVRKHTNE